MKLKKPHLHPPHLYEMAKSLNLERRLHPRVKIPMPGWEDFTGPQVVFNGERFPLHDLSEGGVCLIDQSEKFAMKMGEELNLTFQCGGEFMVSSRMVAMNLTRRHIQFLSPSASFRESLRQWIQSGLRGQWLKTIDSSIISRNHPILWSSIYDDSLTFSDDPRWQYNLCVDGETFLISSELWPVHGDSLKPISKEEFDQLLTFLENLTFSNEISYSIKHSLALIRGGAFE